MDGFTNFFFLITGKHLRKVLSALSKCVRRPGFTRSRWRGEVKGRNDLRQGREKRKGKKERRRDHDTKFYDRLPPLSVRSFILLVLSY